MNDDLALIREYLATQSSNACFHLVSRHERSVFGMCYKILRNREEAEEAAQDSFLKFFDSLPKLREIQKFKSWLLSIAYRTAIDLYRKRKPASSNIENVEEVKTMESKDPELIYQHINSSELMQQLFASMGEQDASILTLFYQDDLPVKEIAKVLNLTESNVKIRLMRTRDILRMKMQGLYNRELKK